MTLRQWRHSLPLLLLSVGTLFIPTVGRAAPTALPDSVVQEVEDLKGSFRAVEGTSWGTTGFPQEVERNAPAIDRVLKYASSSTDNAELVVAYLCESLNAYSRRSWRGPRNPRRCHG